MNVNLFTRLSPNAARPALTCTPLNTNRVKPHAPFKLEE